MSATPADDAQTSPAWNCGCKDTDFFALMQENSDFFAIFSLEAGVTRRINAEHKTDAEERQKLRMYRSDRKGTEGRTKKTRMYSRQ